MSEFIAPPTPEEVTAAAALYGKKVELVNLKAATLNGKTGNVLNTPISNGRVQVKLEAVGSEVERIVSLKIGNLKVVEVVDKPALLASSEEKKKLPRPAAMTGRPGKFKFGWDWREVLPGQDLPPGLEIMASFEEGVPTIARIPRKWYVDVFLVGNDSEHVKVEVFRTTTVKEVVEGFRKVKNETVGGVILVGGKEYEGKYQGEAVERSGPKE
ncbi:hypothetical protein TrLO_g2130 [Triparma laevis f. longispina]|uniref:Uncharacterized protein n=1 Tax=Triparma laevis f. longispina TaxID=1714387 RepID=A0A9W7KW99_9STRA|nr:hypothetical protein TrLO_g2130 [Triparma laevis f. longispina]